jgi:hypothetical protein
MGDVNNRIKTLLTRAGNRGDALLARDWFFQGVAAYEAARASDERQALLADAAAYLGAATLLNGRDPYYWFFRALALRGLGDTKAARAAVRRGTALVFVGGASRQPAGAAEGVEAKLERIQGPERRFLQSEDRDMTQALAAQILSAPDPELQP